MKSRLTLLAGALALAPLAAQSSTVTTSIQTLSPVAVLSQIGTTRQWDGWAANQPIGSSPYSMRLSESMTVSPDYASSHCLSYPQPLGNSAAILERGYARGAKTTTAGSSASSSATGATWGAHSFLVTITGKSGTPGVISVSWHSKNESTSAIQGWIDIGNDSSVEWNPGGTMAERKTWKLTLGTTPTVIKVTVQGQVTGTGNALDYRQYFVDCFVAFIEDKTTTVSVTKYGAGCGGATLDGGSILVGQEHVFALKCTGGFANAWAISAVGNTQIGLPLPGSCTLLSNAVVLTLLKADAQGVSSEGFKSGSTKAFTSYHQYLPIDLQGNNLVLRATNGLKIVSQ